MRKLLVASEEERDDFWTKIEKRELPQPPDPPPTARFVRALSENLPTGAQIVGALQPRSAGTGSLGRPRWVALAYWKGEMVVREAKAILPSAWTLAFNVVENDVRVAELAKGTYRAPDPWYRLVDGNLVVRRLSPNNRKLGIDSLGEKLFKASLLSDMGHELANVHRGTTDSQGPIEKDLNSRGTNWLEQAAKIAVDVTLHDFAMWKNGRS